MYFTGVAFAMIVTICLLPRVLPCLDYYIIILPCFAKLLYTGHPPACHRPVRSVGGMPYVCLHACDGRARPPVCRTRCTGGVAVVWWGCGFPPSGMCSSSCPPRTRSRPVLVARPMALVAAANRCVVMRLLLLILSSRYLWLRHVHL